MKVVIMPRWIVIAPCTLIIVSHVFVTYLLAVDYMTKYWLCYVKVCRNLMVDSCTQVGGHVEIALIWAVYAQIMRECLGYCIVIYVIRTVWHLGICGSFVFIKSMNRSKRYHITFPRLKRTMLTWSFCRNVMQVG